jgi:hypothetical protein
MSTFSLKKHAAIILLVVAFGFSAGFGVGVNSNAYSSIQILELFLEHFKVGDFSESSTRALKLTKKTFSAPLDLPVFEISIKDKAYSKLKYSRQQALRTALLTTFPDSYVKGTLKYADQKYKIKLRLKGDLIDHYGGDKWSFRVKVSGDNTILGMKKFSLQHPIVRNYLGEWFFHKAAKNEGLISLRYTFVRVFVNAEYKGIYSLEEHFDKRLIENNKRKEAPIMKINEEVFFGHGWKMYNKARFTAFQESKINEIPTLSDQYKAGNKLLEMFRSGDIGSDSVFDHTYYSKFVALSDLLGGWHALESHNLVFYFNPFTYLFEPIVYDGSQIGSHRILELSITKDSTNADSIIGQLFRSNLAFTNMYIKNLYRMSKDSYLDTLLTLHAGRLDKLNDILATEYAYSFSPLAIKANHDKINELIDSESKIHVEIDSNNKLTMKPAGSFPIELNSITTNQEVVSLSGVVLSNVLADYQNNHQVMLGKSSTNGLGEEAVQISYVVAGKNHTMTVRN